VSRADVDAAVVALRAGGLVVVPTDTVYGLACDPDRPEAVARLAAVKARTLDQPIALVAASLEILFDRVPELPGRLRVVASELLPGPFTLVLPNPAERLPWLAGGRPDTIGVRVPDVTGIAKTLLEIFGAVAATSANLHGGADPRSVEDVPVEIAGAAVVVDGGELPGTPSTVVDLTGPEPIVLREGAVPADEALARVHRLLPE
jgi:L-threonylcarbamoyladenylate synthase